MAGIALRQVRAVIAVCEEGSFTRAAARENATQSGISQHVAAVERALGVRLFERSARGVRPTAAGLRYYKSCVEAVGRLENANEEARGIATLMKGYFCMNRSSSGWICVPVAYSIRAPSRRAPSSRICCRSAPA